MKILYYAHHHGSGHLKNALYFQKFLKNNLWIATSRDINNNLSKPQIIALASEDESGKEVVKGREMLPHYLHYSPMGNSNILKRSVQMLETCIKNGIQLAIIDLSVEVAALFRAASVPFAYVRLPGNRNDTPHLECFRAALFLLAYYPQELEDDNTPQWVIDKTIYLGFLYHKENENSPQLTSQEQELIQNDQPYNLVVKGFGGHELVDQKVSRFREKLEGKWVSVGPIDDKFTAYYDIIIPYSQNVTYLMQHSNRIIIPPSLNLTAEALYANKPITVIPDDRHFDEHEIMAKNLIKNQYADSTEEIRTNFRTFNPRESSEVFINQLRNAKDIKSFYNMKINY